MGFVVDFPDAFPAQEFQKFIHISIELFLLKQVMKGEGTAFFYYPQCLPHHLALVRLGAHLVKDKIAHCRVKAPVRERQMGRIALAEMDGRNLLDAGISSHWAFA